MTQGLIGGLALLALLTQAQSNQSAPPQSHSYTVETIRAGARAPGAAQSTPGVQNPVTVQRDLTPPVFELQNRVQRGPCNMPIIVANADIDPRMIVPIERKNTEARIRVIEPGACGAVQRAVGVKR